MRSNLTSPPTDAVPVPLTALGPGQTGVVVDVRGGHGLRRRLCAMGLVPGAWLTVASGVGGGGPIIIEILGTRLALGRGMASKVLVQAS